VTPVTLAPGQHGAGLRTRHAPFTGLADPISQADVYNALPDAAYGGEKEEAGWLLSKPTMAAGSPLPGTVQASRPSREGPIIAMRMQLSQATQRRKR
jgi:hypothetical protein